MSSLLQRLRYRATHGTRRAFWMRAYMRAKARAGMWDHRMLNGHPDVQSQVRRYIMRGIAAGLVVTSTTDGQHAPNSWHYKRRAADMGTTDPGTVAARDRMVRFQHQEYQRWNVYIELLGPDDATCVLNGFRSQMQHGSALERLHENHVHGAL